MAHRQTPSQKRRRRILYAMHPHCYWCGVLLDPSWYYPSRYAATIDHVRPRQVKKQRGDIPGGEVTVLACAACNTYRNDATQKGWKQPQDLPSHNVLPDESTVFLLAARCAIVSPQGESYESTDLE